MKALKYLLYAIGALIVLLLVAIGIVFALFDPNDYKPQIVQLVKERTGRTLTISGDIKLKIFPKIGAAVGKTTLSERNRDRVFAGVDEAQVYLALIPLFSKQLVVDQVRLDGLRADLIKHKDGSTNFSDLTGAEAGEKKAPEQPRQEAPKPQAATKASIKLDVSGIRITNSRVTWLDESNGNDLAIELVELKTGRVAERVPSPVQLDLALRGAKPKADLRAKLLGVLTLDLANQQYSFKGLDAKLSGSALDLTGITAALKADLEAEGAKQLVKVSGLSLDAKANRGKDSFDLKLSAPRVQSSPEAVEVEALSVSATGSAAGVTLTESSLKTPMLRVNLAANQVLLRGLALAAKGKLGLDNLAVNLSAPKLEITKDRASGESASLAAKLAGPERTADVTLKLSAVEGSAKALKIAALVLDIDGKQKDNAVKGTLSTPISANLETRVFELPKIDAQFTVTSPSIPQKTAKVPLSGTVRADLGGERVTANIAAQFDESHLKAKLGMTRFATPAYDFDIDIDKLNLDKYAPPKQKSAQGEKPVEPTTPAPKAKEKEAEKPIDFSPLKALNLDGRVKIGELIADNIKASSVRVDMRAKSGKLDVDPMQANLYQGALKGSASVNANTNQIAVRQALSGISIGPLLRDAVRQDILEGRGNVDLDITTTGNTVSAFKQALNGTASLSLKDGAIKGVDLAGAVRSIKSKLGGQDAEQSANTAQKTDFTELTASFTIKNGVAHNGDLSAKSPFVRISGEGDVNIAQDNLDYVVKAAVVASTAGQGGKERAELTGLTLPVRIYGPYDALKYKLQFSQMLSGANKEALKEMAKEALKEGGKVQLKDLGKQLLGGEKAPGPSGDQPANGDQAQPAQPAKKPEDALKEKLKGLLR
ncbi:MAG TPA: AsmA family protein [Burkholderiales bacterium]|nr:AsmA family protein [Burkholderiales bacterium]